MSFSYSTQRNTKVRFSSSSAAALGRFHLSSKSVIGVLVLMSFQHSAALSWLPRCTLPNQPSLQKSQRSTSSCQRNLFFFKEVEKFHCSCFVFWSCYICNHILTSSLDEGRYFSWLSCICVWVSLTLSALRSSLLSCSVFSSRQTVTCCSRWTKSAALMAYFVSSVKIGCCERPPKRRPQWKT